MTKKRKIVVALSLIVSGIIGVYLILNQYIVLDRTSQELGNYDFVSSQADVEVLVEGTGKQNILGDRVSTKIKIVNILFNNTSSNLVEGSEIEANEYLVVHHNIQVSGLQWTPGRSIFSMGTSYKRLKKGEQKTIHLKLNKETNQFWIMPKELVIQ
ncbi:MULTISPECIES: hypothetical protein [unclassified Paenibacillus]|uniref:hypothetical protein n=1 Tax=unclassified Paenibacillus TaxID=185978 RepID=UPI0009A869B4|nr:MULTISPECIES: hypothetical protein [unclassified Paenibacillus]SLJ96725.1 hypothetical protein SAMN06272722_102441 [Paenibacillus sp. RU5A]SOC67074.1 hypothetical protein SAMN05880581_102557 [Paenibacillus sp. RU26A]SOC69778.1 hypothetical protein SAMN05880586_102441 [Paenibacillus sp. RU5M]